MEADEIANVANHLMRQGCVMLTDDLKLSQAASRAAEPEEYGELYAVTGEMVVLAVERV